MLLPLILSLIIMQEVPTDTVTDPDILVKATSLDQYSQSLAACIARHCPPKEEIEQALAYADAQLVAGDYEASRQTLLRARHRNARYAAETPIAVADLHRAVSRLAGLNGSRDASQSGMFNMVDALKAGLPRGDWRILAARLEVGDSFARVGRFEAAISHYRWVARLARKTGASLVEGQAMVREASLLAVMASVDPTMYDARARAAAALVLRRSDPDWAPLRNTMRFVPVQLASAKERDAVLAMATAGLEPVASVEPQLLYAPRADFDTTEFGAAPGGTQPEWSDVAFRISAAGRIDDVTVVRRSAHLPDPWLDRAIEALRARRYAPRPQSLGDDDARRVERYAFVSDLIDDKYSRMPTRSARRHMDILDLTPTKVDPSLQQQHDMLDLAPSRSDVSPPQPRR